jgi:hypothetical protein
MGLSRRRGAGRFRHRHAGRRRAVDGDVIKVWCGIQEDPTYLRAKSIKIPGARVQR